MKKSHKFLTLFLLTACAAGGQMVTMDMFYDVPIGATTPEVISCIGKPYAIHERCDGILEYEYIERIKIGAREAEERRYFLIIRDGQVVSKRVLQNIPLPYGFDSYEMQTTQKEDQSRIDE